jgi:hypothetical protein
LALVLGLAAEILASPAYKTTMDRVRTFVQQGGGCRATYFNHGRKLNGDAAGKMPEGARRESADDSKNL